VQLFGDIWGRSDIASLEIAVLQTADGQMEFAQRIENSAGLTAFVALRSRG